MCSRVIDQESCTVSPQAETVIPEQYGRGQIGYYWWSKTKIARPLHIGSVILVARCLIDLQKQVLTVRVFNPTQHICRIGRGTDLTSCAYLAGASFQRHSVVWTAVLYMPVTVVWKKCITVELWTINATWGTIIGIHCVNENDLERTGLVKGRIQT